MGCLDDNTLAALVDGSLSGDARARVDEHLDGCEACRALVAALAPHAARVADQEATVRNAPVPRAKDSFTELHVRPSSSEPLLRAGLRVDHYEIVRRVGRGGMGEVYLARDLELARKVALKVIGPGLFDSPEALARFRHEAQVMARLSHPSIVTVHAVGAFRNMPYVAMEFVEGTSLAERLKTGPLPEAEAIGVALQIVEALEAAHERGVAHRDLKPANVMLGTDGRLRVLDFGLARVSDTDDAPSYVPTLVKGDNPLAPFDAQVGGTPAYMAPEQWERTPADSGPASDVWALGVMLHELVLGDTPFSEATNLVELARVVHADRPRVHPDAALSPTLRRVIEGCLRRDHRRRPRLREVRQALTSPASPPPVADPETRVDEVETVPMVRRPSPDEILAAGRALEAPSVPVGRSESSLAVPPGSSPPAAPLPRARWAPVVVALVIGAIVGALVVGMARGQDGPPAREEQAP